MKGICPYCGRQQDDNNIACQFCGASLAEVLDKAGREEEGSATTLCNMCMRSFPVAKLIEHEGQKVCAECLKKIKMRESSLAPLMQKSAVEKAPPRSGRILFAIFCIGILFFAGVAGGGYYVWRMASSEKQRRVDEASVLFAPVIEKNNKAVALLHQYKTESAIAGEAARLLAEALRDISTDKIKAACSGVPAIDRYRLTVMELLRKRLTAAKTLTGETDPSVLGVEAAFDLIAETDESASVLQAELAKRLRFWQVSAEPFLLY